MDKQPQIVVTTEPLYIAEQSDPASRKFVWSYEITIENESDKIVQLLNRFWRITDASGKVEEVSGPGVVGLQPIIKPNATFTYKSFCQLLSPQGVMEGYYEMQDLEDLHFIVEIPKFALIAPVSVVSPFRNQLH